MVSQPTTPTQTEDLPTLTDWEAELLAHFLILRYDMVALAETRKLNAHQLLAFARSRAVQAHLTELRKFADTAFALRALESRIAAIDTLETVAKNSTDLVEKRRAASAILRGLNPSSPRPFRSSVAFPPTHRAASLTDQAAAIAEYSAPAPATAALPDQPRPVPPSSSTRQQVAPPRQHAAHTSPTPARPANTANTPTAAPTHPTPTTQATPTNPPHPTSIQLPISTPNSPPSHRDSS